MSEPQLLRAVMDALRTAAASDASDTNSLSSAVGDCVRGLKADGHKAEHIVILLHGAMQAADITRSDAKSGALIDWVIRLSIAEYFEPSPPSRSRYGGAQ